MTRKALMEKAKKKPKFAVRAVRICFRREASFGSIPGVRKASW